MPKAQTTSVMHKLSTINTVSVGDILVACRSSWNPVPLQIIGTNLPEIGIVEQINKKSVRLRLLSPNELTRKRIAVNALLFENDVCEHLQYSLCLSPSFPTVENKRKLLTLTTSGDLKWSAYRYRIFSPDMTFTAYRSDWEKDEDLKEAMMASGGEVAELLVPELREIRRLKVAARNMEAALPFLN